MGDISVSRLEVTEVEWLESAFNARWPWPREAGFVAALIVASSSTEPVPGPAPLRREAEMS